MARVQFIVMAGGKGERLRPLTEGRPKPLVRFGSSGRIIDFTLCNCLSSGEGKVSVLTQYLSDKIEGYLFSRWRKAFAGRGMDLEILPAELSIKGAYLGTADAVYQALALKEQKPDYVVVLAGDHVYQMDYSPMLEDHIKSGAAATVGAVECEREDASRFGIIVTDGDGRVTRFVEKPRSLTGVIPPGRLPLASMGIYAFSAPALMTYLEANQEESSHDFGHDVLPEMVASGRVRVHRFVGKDGQSGYWRDVGDLAGYWKTSIEMLRGKRLLFNYQVLPDDPRPPLSDNHFVKRYDHNGTTIINSMISDTARIGKATIEESIIGPGVQVRDGAALRRSVLLDGADVGKWAELEDVVVEPYSIISAGYKSRGWSAEGVATRGVDGRIHHVAA